MSVAPLSLSREFDPRERSALLDVVATAARADAQALAKAYTAARDLPASSVALADGHVLGSGAICTFVRRLANARGSNSLKKLRADRMGRSAYVARDGLSDGLSRPGARLLALVPKGTSLAIAAHDDAPSVAYTDAASPAIAVNLALSEIFAERRKTTLVVETAAVIEPIRRLLAAAEAKGLVKIETGGVRTAIDAGREAGANRVIGVTSRKKRSELEAVTGEAIAGFATDVPSTFVITPFFYDRSEVERMARQAVAELTAPPCATRGVEIIVSRTWTQRVLFEELVNDELKFAEKTVELRVVRRSGETPTGSEPGIAMVEVDSDDTTEFFALTKAHLATAEEGTRWLVSTFAHPMELEEKKYTDALDAFLGEIPATTLGLNARASLAYLDGRLPVGKRENGAQNALGVRKVERVVYEAPLRWVATDVRGVGMARARYEAAPSFGRALGLGVRAFL